MAEAAIDACKHRVPGNEHDAVAGELAGHRHRLFGLAEIVADYQLDLLAEYTAAGVEVRDRESAPRW